MIDGLLGEKVCRVWESIRCVYWELLNGVVIVSIVCMCVLVGLVMMSLLVSLFLLCVMRIMLVRLCFFRNLVMF